MGTESLSTWSTVILMLPFFLFLAAAMFGADKRLAAPRSRGTRAGLCSLDADGEPELTDPGEQMQQPGSRRR